MKLEWFPLAELEIMSLPVWEEWIEIVVPDYTIYPNVSLPVWEEWIEMAICGN